MRTPDFFIVGAAKSGTTSMYEYLRQHPDIYMPATKWINYFNTDLESPGNCRDRDEYLSFFAGAGHEKRVGEASESYLYSKQAAHGIHAACPQADIIIMLRNPVDMLHSLHSQLLFSHVEDIEDFGEALAAETQRKNGQQMPAAAHHPPQWLFYRETARLAEQVQRYLETFGPDHVHFIVFEDFATDPHGTYRDTLQFLNVDPKFAVDFKVYNANTTVRSRGLDRMIREPPMPVKRLVTALLPSPTLRKRVTQRLSVLNVKRTPRAALAVELRAQLQQEFQPEVERLGRIIGRDLSRWSKALPPGS